jgi:hypothetical protein
MPEPQRPAVSDQSKRGDRREQECVAGPQQDAGDLRVGDLGQNRRVLRCEKQRRSQRHQAEPGQQAGYVLGPPSLGVIFGEQSESVNCERSNQEKVHYYGNCFAELHLWFIETQTSYDGLESRVAVSA